MIGIAQSVDIIRKGGVIAYPTEAVYGLGCDPNNAHALGKIIELKKRDPSKGLILIGAILDHVLPFVGKVESQVLQRAVDTWPGAHTWIFPAGKHVPDLITGGTGNIAIRVSSHPVVKELCNAFSGAVVSTSANTEGEPAAQSYAKVLNYFPNIQVLEGELGDRANPSTITDAITGKILRG